jgi:cell wall-associated protease
MDMRSRIILVNSLLALSLTIVSTAQTITTRAPLDWFLRDPEIDHVQGVSAERAYEFLKGRPSRTVIVAVVDTGIDIEHEDLKSVIWTNEDEIPGNGLDDDKNGYVDDIHGWNFIGGKNGNVLEDTGELTREYARLTKLYGNVEESKVPRKKRSEYENYKKIKTKFEKLRDQNREQYDNYGNLYKNMRMSVDTLKAVMKIDKLTPAALDTFKATNPTLAFAKGFTTSMLKRMGPVTDIDSLLIDVSDAVKYYEVVVDYSYNPDFDSRIIVGDDYSNVYERNYGNNDVAGPDPEHGTHVAGIIAADRKNNIGIKGIADNVRIMSVRTVPNNGDERDKDVANAIIYAVDNGAQIINMSFGKNYSPEKPAVDAAVKYAAKKGVILIHAAGNDGQDIDAQRDFPTRYFQDGKEAPNWLEVGATAWGTEDDFVATFSNYGKKSVDLFAPGVDIYSTVPKNKFKKESGTSMACPAASGVAALLMSYFPELSGQQVLDILKKSTRKFDGLRVHKPSGGKTSFSDLSNTGGLINAWQAVQMAQQMKGAQPER